MDVSQPMNTFSNGKNTKPVRYITIAGSSTKSCRKLKSLFKHTSYYCLVDCFKNSNEMLDKEIFYIPDCVILEIRSLRSFFSINKQAEKLQEAFPGIKLVLYYNMLRRCPLLEQRNNQYPQMHKHDDEEKQLQDIEHVLKKTI